MAGARPGQPAAAAFLAGRGWPAVLARGQGGAGMRGCVRAAGARSGAARGGTRGGAERPRRRAWRPGGGGAGLERGKGRGGRGARGEAHRGLGLGGGWPEGEDR